MSEAKFDTLERDAFAELFRAGKIVEGDLIPWRGYREAWLGGIGARALALPTVENAKVSQSGVLAAALILSSIEFAFHRDGEGAFGCQAVLATVAPVAEAARVHDLTVVRGRQNRQGRKGELDSAQLEALRSEVRELALEKPHLKPWALASELVEKHKLRMNAETLQRQLGKLTKP